MTEARRPAPRKKASPPAKALAKPAAVAAPAHHHPSLGLAPADMTAGFPRAAEMLRREAPAVAARALEAALAADETMNARYDEIGLRRLVHDAETLVGRLAMCVASDDPRWLVEFVEWTGPIFRRRRVSLLDVAALCEGIRTAATATLDRDARPAADRAITAATELLRRNARLAGDTHKRSALWRWMYRGV